MPNLDYSSVNNFGGVALGTGSKSRGTVTVPVATLDSFAIENVGLIKIDVEGFEEEVLKGGIETINRCRPVLYIEDDRPQKSASLRQFLKELGYRFELHEPPLFRSSNFFGNPKNIWGSNICSRNLVCFRE